MKKKKIAKSIISLVIWAGIGFSIGFFASMVAIPPEYTVLPWYMVILLIAVVYFVAVALHELGHAFSFSKNGINMRAVFITSLLFIKEDGKWKMKFRPNGVTLLGGIAIPDLEAVKSSEEIDRLQKGYAKAILAGPIATIIVWAVLTGVSILLMVFSSHNIVNAVAFTLAASITIISIFLLGTCFVKSEVAIGDFPAYQLAKNDRFFVVMQLYQYALFSSDYERVRAENYFLRHTLVEGLKKKLDEKDTHMYTIGLIDQFITEYLSGTNESLPQVVWDYVDFLTNDDERLSTIKKSELSLTTYLHIVRLLYINEETKEKAISLYTSIDNEIKPTTPMRKYLLKQTEHALELDDHSEFLRDKQNICTSPAHGLWKNFEGYFADEIKINQTDHARLTRKVD